MPTKLPLIGKGDAIEAEGAKGENEVRKAVNGLLGMGVDPATMTLMWAGSTPYLGATPQPERLYGALTPSGGIPPATGAPPTPGTASGCTLYDLGNGGVWVARPGTIPVLNHFTSTTGTGVGGSKYILVELRGDGTYVVIGEPC
jgi:hypothetical protein